MKSFLVALLMLFAVVETLEAYEPTFEIEHDWHLSINQYEFRLTQTAPIVMPPNQVIQEETIIMPRTTRIHFGSWSASFEGYDAGLILSSVTTIIAISLIAFFIRSRYSDATANRILAANSQTCNLKAEQDAALKDQR